MKSRSPNWENARLKLACKGFTARNRTQNSADRNPILNISNINISNISNIRFYDRQLVFVEWVLPAGVV